jgi:arylsulfatase A-like enzyme
MPGSAGALVSGFSPDFGELGHAWMRQDAELRIALDEPRAAVAAVRLSKAPSIKKQSARILLNGHDVEKISLADKPRMHLIPLPARLLRAGENRLRFVFGDEGPVDGRRRLWAGRMHSCVFWGFDEVPWSMDPLARRSDDGSARIEQVSGSALFYAFRLPRRAELRFAVERSRKVRAASGDIGVRIRLERLNGSEIELWSRRLTHDKKSRDSAALKLPGRINEIVRLSLCVDQSQSGAPDAVSWINPRVMGASAPPETSWGRPSTARAGGARSSGKTPINVMLVVLDAARADHMGCYGYARATTPEIDRIASDGVVFDRAYTPAVYTLGAMSALWTSQYPDRFHIGAGFTSSLPPERVTLPELLETRGIPTVGIVANAMAGRGKGLDRGFSRFIEVLGDDERPSDAADLTRSFENWLKDRQDDRFFAYLHFREPHFPYDPPTPFATMFGPDSPLGRLERSEPQWYKKVNHGEVAPTADQVAHLVRLYDGNLAYVDQEVGKIHRALEEHGLWERTALFLLADHGEQLLESGHVGHNAQVREESARVPLVARIPGRKGGRRVKAFVDLLDLAPTIMELYGLNPSSAEESFEGRSLLPVIDGAAGKPAVLTRTVWARPVYGVQDRRGKYVYDSRTGHEGLYDLGRDPQERHNRCSVQPILCAYYRQSLLDWLRRLRPTGATRPGAAHALTREHCKNLKLLGYYDGECP